MRLQLRQLLLLMPRFLIILPNPPHGEVILMVQQLLRQHVVGGVLGIGQPITAVDVEEQVYSSMSGGGGGGEGR